MNVFDSYIAMVKVEKPTFVFNGNRSLMSLRDDLLKAVAEPKNRNYAERLARIAEDINPFKCYYSAIQEILVSADSADANQINYELLSWFKDVTNHDVRKLKNFVQERMDIYSPKAGWLDFLSSQNTTIFDSLKKVLDEIPSEVYANQSAKIFDDILALLDKHIKEDSSWASNIEVIKASLNADIAKKTPYMEIKQALRQACEDLLTPGRLSFYSAPALKEALKELLEGIPSERYIKTFDMPCIPAEKSLELGNVQGLYLSKQSQSQEMRRRLRSLSLESQSAHSERPNLNPRVRTDNVQKNRFG
jgi:hypothetical protein